MKINKEWQDYEILTTGDGQKLEKIAGYTFLRPDPQVIWQPPFPLEKQKGLSAVYTRSSTGGGAWQKNVPVAEKFYVHWRDLTFELRLMNFKHIGIFPEQAVNWDRMTSLISQAARKISVLNLFGYTGGATVACLKAGADVCHVDAAKAMCETAKTNCDLSHADLSHARFIVDDCVKFVEREIRRGRKYDAVLMDPPAYGRGPKGEMWRLEDKIFDLVELTKGVLKDTPLFFLINSYTTGSQPTVMKNIIDIVFKDMPHETDADEIGLPCRDGLVLPCGCSAFAQFHT